MTRQLPRLSAAGREHLLFAPHQKQLATRGQHQHIRTTIKHILDQSCAGLQDVLAVVEHEQHAANDKERAHAFRQGPP
jgi:CTP:molybdopterin cytidylyltransferase MocA